MLERNEESYLVTQNLSKSFGTFEAVRDVSISIKEGEFVCFLGPSGCGKTTLLRCIAGLEIQSTGSIIQKNNDISVLPPSSRDFGIVFQSYAIFPNLSVFANIAYGLANNKWSKQDIKQRVDELLELVNLTEHANKYPSHLSGGEQQRVSIARAIVNKPPLILADEPTGELDSSNAWGIFRLFKEMVKEEGISVVSATHDSTLLDMADEVAEIRNGSLALSSPDFHSSRFK